MPTGVGVASTSIRLVRTGTRINCVSRSSVLIPTHMWSIKYQSRRYQPVSKRHGFQDSCDEAVLLVADNSAVSKHVAPNLQERITAAFDLLKSRIG